MKKRRQQPDGYTYTIVLRGLALHSRFSKSLERALTVYHSMFAPDSLVRPSIIHTNAAIKVCAQVGDLDAMFGIAARLPKSGPRAADRATFTTVFNALNRVVFDDNDPVRDESLLENIDKRQNAVLKGRRMWADIIERWNEGDMILDEALICAVGRLLLLADVPQDLDDVFSLLEQTMGVPRQTPRRPREIDGTRALSEKDVESPAQENKDLVQPIEPERKPFADVDDEFVPGSEFLPLPSVGPTAYAIPSRSTLSLVVDACTRLKLFSAAQDYWTLLTGSRYNIVPDTANYHMYLRLLRAQRASRQCVEIVEDMRDGLGTGSYVPSSAWKSENRSASSGVTVSTFRIALSACSRDIKNPNVMEHASKLVRIMYDCLPEADVGILNTYVEITRQVTGDDYRALSAALRNTELGAQQLQGRLCFGTAEEDKQSEEYLAECREVNAFFCNLFGAYDKLISLHNLIRRTILGSKQEVIRERIGAYKQLKMVSSWQTEVSKRLGVAKVSSRDINDVLMERQRQEEEEVASADSDWKREAIIARQKAEKYTRGGRNKRMAMAQYLRRLENESM